MIDKLIEHFSELMDVTFREDDSRVRDPTAARNFALLRKLAINLVDQDRATKASL